jgi:hypothetical protein
MPEIRGVVQKLTYIILFCKGSNFSYGSPVGSLVITLLTVNILEIFIAFLTSQVVGELKIH